MICWLIPCGALVSAAIIYLMRRDHFIGLLLQIPPFTCVPILGDLYVIFRHKFDMVQALSLVNWQYGDAYRLWAGRFMVIVSSTEDMETLSTNPLIQDRGPLLESYAENVGTKSLLTSNWNSDIKLIKKAFHRNFTGSSQEIIFENFLKANLKLLQILASREGAFFDVFHDIIYTTSTAIVGSALDCDIEEYPAMMGFQRRSRDAGLLLVYRVISLLHRNDFMYYNLLGGKKVSSMFNDCKEDIKRIIQLKQRQLEGMTESGQAIPNQYIYNIIQENKNRESNEDVITEIFTLLASALETSATTAAFTLLVLAIHQDVQELVYEEDKRIQVELAGEILSEKNISRYEYLSLIIKEVLRMYPPIPLSPRILNGDIQFGKFTAPKGIVIMGSSLSLHRDPSLYNNPSVFNPERFSGGNSEKIPKHAYLPFGTGPRNCPGSRYGTHSAIFLVSTVIRNYKVYTKFKSTKDLDNNLEFTTVLGVKGGFSLLVKRR